MAVHANRVHTNGVIRKFSADQSQNIFDKTNFPPSQRPLKNDDTDWQQTKKSRS